MPVALHKHSTVSVWLAVVPGNRLVHHPYKQPSTTALRFSRKLPLDAFPYSNSRERQTDSDGGTIECPPFFGHTGRRFPARWRPSSGCWHRRSRRSARTGGTLLPRAGPSARPSPTASSPLTVLSPARRTASTPSAACASSATWARTATSRARAILMSSLRAGRRAGSASARRTVGARRVSTAAHGTPPRGCWTAQVTARAAGWASTGRTARARATGGGRAPRATSPPPRRSPSPPPAPPRSRRRRRRRNRFPRRQP